VKLFEVEVDKNKVIVPSALLAVYFGKNASTVANWKSQKGMATYDIQGKKNRYELISTIEWKKANIKEKFSPNRKNIEIDPEDLDEDFKVELPFGMQIGTVDLDNSQHLAVLALHPFGEQIRDTLKAREDIRQKGTKTAEMRKELINMNDVDKSMSEQAIIHKQDLMNSEKSFPTMFANKSKAYINKEYRKFNDKRLGDLDKIIEKTFPNMKSSMYDLISIAQALYVDGVNMDKMVSKLEELKGEEDGD